MTGGGLTVKGQREDSTGVVDGMWTRRPNPQVGVRPAWPRTWRRGLGEAVRFRGAHEGGVLETELVPV